MNIFRLLQNPLVKIIGVAAVLYFGLLYKNDSPESLSKRLDPDLLKSEIGEAKEKGQFILSNLNEAKSAQIPAPKPVEIAEEIITNDLVLGNGPDEANCGDELLMDYKIYDAKGRKIDQKDDIKLIANPAATNVIAKNIIGAKKGGIREINVPYSLETSDEEIIYYKKKALGSFKYQIIVKNINRAKDAQNCPQNEKK